MIQYSINTGNSSQLSIFYDEWDISEEDKRYDWNKLTSLDKDKYIKFDDGSNLYAKIILVARDYVRTSAGLFRIKDIIHCSKPKYKHWGYSGASDNEESFDVRPPSKNEIAKAKRLMNGHKPRTMTRRVRMCFLDLMKEEAEKNGVDHQYIFQRLKGWADGNGQHAYKSLVSLAKLTMGTDIEKGPEQLGDGRPKSIADLLGISGTVQDNRKLPIKEIKKIAPIEEAEVSKIENSDGVYKNESDNRSEIRED